MTDILLTHGYFLADDAKEREIMKPYPPLGLLSLSAYLKTLGYSVDVYDSTFGTQAELMQRLGSGRGVLGIYTNLVTRPVVLQIIATAARSGWTTILGGPESANYPEEYLNAGADVVVIGEGEATLAELLATLPNGGAHRLHAVSGIVFKDEDGVVVRTHERSKIPDLDS